MDDRLTLFEPVSVVVVNHNAGVLLVECVTSALEQAQEVVVVDNASTDGSMALLEQPFVSAMVDQRLKLLHADSNLGFAMGCNLGVGAGDGLLPYLLFLNPDSSLSPGSLSRMVGVLREQDDVGMVGGLLINLDGSEQGGGRRAVPTPWRSFVRAFGLSRFESRWPKLFYDFHLHKQPLPAVPIEVEAISGACMLVKREAMDDVGGWDEGYFLHCEDLDWCMRFRQRGWRVLFVPDAPVVHHLGACSRSRPLFVEWHKHQGMIRFYQKFFRHQYPGIIMWLVGLGVWLRFGGVVIYYTMRRIGRRVDGPSG